MDNLSFEDIVENYLATCQNGGNPNIETFANNYPKHKEELLEILPLLQDLEDIGYKKSRQLISGNSVIPDLTNSDYRLIKKIGAGAMGTVFEAQQISLDRKVALKVLSPSLVTDKIQRNQFEKEARIIAMLHHPNIVKILNAKCTKDCCYYAMELIEGKGLNQCKFTDIREIAGLGSQAARALAYAHRCKIMHRDIKPANILLDNQGQIHISDFGLAFVLKDNSGDFGDLSLKSGTLRYMAPEKLLKGQNTFLTDQYSFGVTLYEMVTRNAFIKAPTQKELIDKITNAKTPKLSCYEPDFSAIVNKCLSFNPQDRYSDMDALAQDLDRFINNEPVQARNYTAMQRYALWKKRKPAAALFSLIAVICALAFILALCIGFIETKAALNLAQKNADMADSTLSKVFNYIETQPPSSSGSVLLDTLMPYYQQIAEQNNVKNKKIIEANKIVGLHAMRSGNYKLAEKSYRKLFELTGSANSLNKLAEALEKQNKKISANAIRNELIEKFENSPKSNDKYETVIALQALGDDTRAFGIIKNLLQQEPANPEYKYRYAVILGNNPKRFFNQRIIGIEPNAVILLKKLAQDYPNNPEYGIAIVDIMTRKLRYANNFSAKDWDNLDIALQLSDKLLAKFPNTPDVITSVVNLKMAYIRALRRSGNMKKSRKEIENLLGHLELLFYNSETPNIAKEVLLELQLERLELFTRDNRTEAISDMSVKINNELQSYSGSRYNEFKNRYLRLQR